jgi:diguanylate cyclase (GGDEF)-like protein/PAS domain S-box-containing protein
MVRRRSSGRRLIGRGVPQRATDAQRTWARLRGDAPALQSAFLLEVGRPGRHRFRYVAVNQAFRDQLAPHGIDGDTPIVGRTPGDLLPTEFVADAEARYEQVVTSGEPLFYEAGFDLPEGSLAYEIVLEPIGDARGGACTHLLGVARERAVLGQGVAVRESEHRFAALLEHSSDMVSVVDLEGHVIYASPAAERMLGWSMSAFALGADPAEARTGFDIIHPDDADRVHELLVRTEGGPRVESRVELRVIRPDGEVIWIEAIATNRLDDPAIGGMVVNARDITDRKVAEAELAGSNEYFRSLVQHASEYVTVTGPDGRYIYVSPSVVEFTGRSAEDLIGSPHLEIHPEDADKVFEPLERLRDNASASERFAARLQRHDGVWRNFELVTSRVAGGVNAGALVVNAIDVTERIESEAALRESEERFRSAFEHAPIGMALGSADATILRTNEAFAAMLGRSSDAMVGMRIADFTHPDDWSRTDDRIQRLFAGEISGYQLEKRYLHADGSAVWVSISVSAVRDADGRALYTIAQTEDITERKAVRERLAHQAVHDPLTGLPNRASFLNRLEVALDDASQQRTRVAVLFLDLDHFKVINDSLGHEAGDQLLVTIGHRLRRILRPTDAIARFGGDEFTILSDAVADPDAVMTLAQRVLVEVARPILLTEGEVFVTTSIGIALSGHGTETPQTLVRDADTAMYRAKDAGRARAAFFDERVRARTLEHLHTGNALHRALARGEFEVHYQPILELETGRVTRFEALLRWNHPERGLLSPIDFIGLAEETGLIVPIGAWVLDAACVQAAQWAAADPGPPALGISVNLSPRQLVELSLPGEVERTLEHSGLDPDRLWLEITETALMHDTESAASALRVLRNQGIHLAVDDFGTGYSSLSHLKGFPVEALKIDQSFVSGLGDNPEDTAIVSAVVSLAHALGLNATAEGVETAEQLAELRTLGCDHAQGHLFSKPLTAAELTDRPRDVLGTWANLTGA